MSHVPKPIILQFHQRIIREANGPRTTEEVKRPACVQECKYLKANVVQVAGLSLMSATLKVICMRFSWPPKGLSFTRTSREMVGFCLNLPASRSSLRATWMVPVTKKAKVRTSLFREKWKVKADGDLQQVKKSILMWGLAYRENILIQTYFLKIYVSFFIRHWLGYLAWPF